MSRPCSFRNLVITVAAGCVAAVFLSSFSCRGSTCGGRGSGGRTEGVHGRAPSEPVNVQAPSSAESLCADNGAFADAQGRSCHDWAGGMSSAREAALIPRLGCCGRSARGGGCYDCGVNHAGWCHQATTCFTPECYFGKWLPNQSAPRCRKLQLWPAQRADRCTDERGAAVGYSTIEMVSVRQSCPRSCNTCDLRADAQGGGHKKKRKAVLLGEWKLQNLRAMLLNEFGYTLAHNMSGRRAIQSAVTMTPEDAADWELIYGGGWTNNWIKTSKVATLVDFDRLR